MWTLKGDSLTLLLFLSTMAVVFLLLLLQIYMVCFLKRASGGTSQSTAGEGDAARGAAAGSASAGANRGLDALAVASLPVFVDASDGRREAADCVVCLSEVKADGGGRVLPRCGHAFHAGCIGRWLASHSACCPICRTPVRSGPAGPSAATGASPPSVVAAVRVDEEVGAAGGDLFAIVEENHLPLLLFY